MSLPVPPKQQPPQDETIVIGNLKRDIDQDALEGLCRKLGEVISFRVHLVGPTPGSLAAAVVQFSSQEEATHAVNFFTGRLISGQPITACIASRGPSHRPPVAVTSTPAATSSSPQQAPTTAATAGTGNYPRAPYPAATSSSPQQAPTTASTTGTGSYPRAPYPAATSSSPQQAPTTASTAGTGSYPRAPYPATTSSSPQQAPATAATTGTGSYSGAPYPAATSSSPQQAPATAATAATGSYPRVPYPHNNGRKMRNDANATGESSGSNPAFGGYRRPQQQPTLDGGPRQSRENWEGGGRGAMPPRFAADHPTTAPRYPTHEAPSTYDEEYSHQHQHQRRLSSGASITPTTETGHHNGADPPRPPPPRYTDGREASDPYTAANEEHPQQWHGSGSRRGESRERQWTAGAADGSSYYTRGGARGGRYPQSMYHTPTATSSAWHDEVSVRSPRRVHRMMPPGGRVSAVAPLPHGMGAHDDGYANDEGSVSAKRPRYSVGAAAGHVARSWGGEPSGYVEKPRTAPRSMPSKENFDKEVMRQAAKMVAERELAAREEDRRVQDEARWRRQQQPRQGEHGGWGENESLPAGPRRPPPRMHDNGVEDRDRAVVSKKREASHDSRGLDRRHAPPPHQRDSRDPGEEVNRDGRPNAKRVRQDASPSGGRAADDKSDSRSVATGATRRHGYRDRRSPVSQRDREKNIQREDEPARAVDDDRARRRGDDRAGHLAPRSRDNSRERDRQLNVQKVEARLAPWSMDNKRGDERGTGRPTKVGTRQQQSDPDRDGERDRKQMGEGHRAGTARRDSRDRERLRDNSKGHQNNGDSHTARDWNRESLRDRNGIRSLNTLPSRPMGNHGSYPDDDGRLGTKRVVDDWSPDRVGNRAPPVYTNFGSTDSSTFHQENATADMGWHVFVKGISISTTFTDLAQRFAAFGDVNGLKAIFNQVACKTERSGSRASGQAVVMASAGVAFISFDNEEGMLKAVEGMNDQVVDGNVLKVCRGRGTKGSGIHHYGPDRSEPDHKTPDRNMPDRRFSDRNVPDSRGPDRNIPNSRGPDRNIPNRNISNRNIPNRNVPDRNVPNRDVSDSKEQESSPTEKLERALKAPRRPPSEPHKQQSKAKHEQQSPITPSPGRGKGKKELTGKAEHNDTFAENEKRSNPRVAITTTKSVGPRIAAAAASMVAAAASAAAANKYLSSPPGTDHRKRSPGLSKTPSGAVVPSNSTRNSVGGGGGGSGRSRDKSSSTAGDTRRNRSGGGPGGGKDSRDRDTSAIGDSKLKRNGSGRT